MPHLRRARVSISISSLSESTVTSALEGPHDHNTNFHRRATKILIRRAKSLIGRLMCSVKADNKNNITFLVVFIQIGSCKQAVASRPRSPRGSSPCGHLAGSICATNIWKKWLLRKPPTPPFTDPLRRRRQTCRTCEGCEGKGGSHQPVSLPLIWHYLSSIGLAAVQIDIIFQMVAPSLSLGG